MKNILISICISNYNYEKFIKEAIDSVLAQTYTNFELIIIDNASTDSSPEIIKTYNDPRIKFCQNKVNIPLYQNINKAMNMAEGDLIAALHSDDKYDPNFLEEIIKAYKQYPAYKVFVTGVYFLHSDKNYFIPWHPYSKTDKPKIKSKKEVLLRFSLENNIGNGVNVVLHKDCLSKAGGFSDKYSYAADFEYWIRLAKKFDFVYIPKILTYYRIHNSNLSHVVNKNLDMFKEGLEIFNKNILENKALSKELYKKISYINERTLVHKAFCMGIKYKSGKISRNMLEYSKKTYPNLKNDPYWYFVYLISYFINGCLSRINLVFISFLGRLILYPYKIYINNFLEKLVKNTNNLNIGFK
ncbi:MAG: glycosyltransferase [bacterium]